METRKIFWRVNVAVATRKQILGRDLRIQILALVKARETDCRIRGKREFPEERMFSVFFLPSLARLPPPPLPLFSRRSRSARFPTVSQTRVLPAERIDLHVCVSESLFYGISSGTKNITRRASIHRIEFAPACALQYTLYIPLHSQRTFILKKQEYQPIYSRKNLVLYLRIFS